jgi:hypothetical protein
VAGGQRALDHQKQADFGINNSHNPHTASTGSYKKYSKFQPGKA